MQNHLLEILALAKKAALEAGACAVRHRVDGKAAYTLKGDRNLVTAADLAAEQIIIDSIKKAFPSHKILSEETNSSIPMEDINGPGLWIIDPIDGTTNYAHGHFNVGISIAYAEHGKVVVGVVYAPFLNEMFEAVIDGGAKLNGTQIKVSECTELQEALIATGFPYQRGDLALLAKRLGNALSKCRDVRRLGAASLDICWVACGRLDGYYESLMPWDTAAGKLIASEAGAVWDHLSMPVAGTLQAALPADLRSHDVFVATPGIAGELKKLLGE